MSEHIAECVAAPDLEPRRAIQAVLSIHGKRVYDGDGYGWAICIEDRQHWPCATVQALLREGFGAE